MKGYVVTDKVAGNFRFKARSDALGDSNHAQFLFTSPEVPRDKSNDPDLRFVSGCCGIQLIC